MNYVHLFGNLIVGMALVACASRGEPAPAIASDSVVNDPQVLPSALMRAAYEAPEWTPDRPVVPQPPQNIAAQQAAAKNWATHNAVYGGQSEPQAQSQAAMVTQVAMAVPMNPRNTIAPNQMNPSEWAAAGQPGPIIGEVAPTALEYQGQEDAVDAAYRQAAAIRPEVPPAPRATRERYTPQVDLTRLDPAIVTDNRAPRAPSAAAPVARNVAYTPQSAPAPMQPNEPLELQPEYQARYANAAPTPAPTDFGGSTTSVMPEAAKVAAREQASGRFGLHLASYRREQNAQAGWGIYRDRHPDVLKGLQARGDSVTLPGRGDFVRLLVGPFATPQDAKALCGALEARQEYCKVMPFEGVPIS